MASSRERHCCNCMLRFTSMKELRAHLAIYPKGNDEHYWISRNRWLEKAMLEPRDPYKRRIEQ